jgi:hypothetical protein
MKCGDISIKLPDGCEPIPVRITVVLKDSPGHNRDTTRRRNQDLTITTKLFQMTDTATGMFLPCSAVEY